MKPPAPLVGLLVLLGATPGFAGESDALRRALACGASPQTGWETGVRDNSHSRGAIAASQVLPIREDLAQATERLDKAPIVPIHVSEASRYTGLPEAKLPSTKGLRPYLVRAIAPLGNAHLDAAWFGDDLVISAHSLGCGPRGKLPLVIYLHARPRAVFLRESGAL